MARKPLAQAGLQHPLMGARIRTLLGTFAGYGLPSVRSAPLVAAMLASAVARAPFAPWEALRFRQLRRRLEGPLPAPVFIVGHWRSGTTHLHNLLGTSPRFAHISPLASGLPDQLLTLATWLRPWLERALPEDRHVDGVAVTPRSPQEDEIPLANQQTLSVFHAVYFPARFEDRFDRGVFFDGATAEQTRTWSRHLVRFLEKVALQQGKAPVLVKNPVYTARIRRLREIWPDARFIHIRRNPYLVYASTLHYYRKLLAQLALQPWDHVDLETFVQRSYLRLMGRYDAEAPAIPSGMGVEVAFEELERNPVAVLDRIHRELSLEGWDEAKPRIEAHLRQVSGYRKNRLELSDAQRRSVEDRWGEYVDRWAYQAPSFT